MCIKEKHKSHIIFAVFCGSVAMMFASKLLTNIAPAYAHLIGIGACATCNAYWLLSRVLFRKKKAIELPHLIFAGSIGVLIVLYQGYLFAFHLIEGTSSSNHSFTHTLSELILLLSSAMLVLSFREGFRGYKSDTNESKAQRIMFLTSFGIALIGGKIASGVLVNTPQYSEVFSSVIALFVIIATQTLIYWKYSDTTLSFFTSKVTLKENDAVNPLNDDALLAQNVSDLLIKNTLYLQPNLRVGDIAQRLDIPEYRVSKVLRDYLCAQNFNQYVNEHRIQHSKNLLSNPENKKWTILTIALESGFASIGPYTRTFKLITGVTPNEYRKHALKNKV